MAAEGAENGSDVAVVGIDWGSTFSAIVLGTKDKWEAVVKNYEGAPTIYGGRREDISEVPSLISVSEGPIFENGYQARTIHGTTTMFFNLKSIMPQITDQLSAKLVPNQTSTESGPQITDETFAELRAQTTEKLSEFSFTAQDLITKNLKYLHAHLKTWCNSRELRLPSTYKTMASHPVCWKAETIIKYQKMLEAAGFQNVDMVNEGEAAANTVLDGMSIIQSENLFFCDLGGETWEFVFYRVHKNDGGVIVKDEIIPCQGGKGGMAVVDELAQAYFTKIFQGMPGGAEKVLKYVQEFSIRKVEYNPSVTGDLVVRVADTAITISRATMKSFHEEALKPILDAMKGLRNTLASLHIKKVFLVGGTAQSEHWLRPDIEDALGEEIMIRYSTHAQCTLVARGAMLAGFEDHITTSRLTNLHLGHLVSREWEAGFSDEAVWGLAQTASSGEKIYEVIQLVKLKGEALFKDPNTAPWHWLTIKNQPEIELRKVLENTKVQLFASDKEKLIIYEHADFEKVAPRLQFNIEIEPRHVFSPPNVEEILKLARPKRGKIQCQLFYAIKIVCDGVGIKLLVGYQSNMSKREEEIRIKSLGGVKWVVGGS